MARGVVMGAWSGARTARGRALVVGAVAVIALVAAACTVTGSPLPESFAPLVELTAQGFSLTWSPAGPDGTVYDLHRHALGPGQSDAWVDLGATTGLAALDHDVVEGVTYQYRLRPTEPGAEPADNWAVALPNTFVRPVLPVVSINTEDDAPIVSRDDYVAGTLKVDPNGSAVAAYSGVAEFKLRGNSTASAEKKPYKIKLDKKSALLGMTTEKDWVLLANAFDRSNLRNRTAFAFGQATDLAWTPHDRFVEVVVNGRYVGLYQLTEQVEVSAARVDVDEMSETDTSGEALTGGYLLEVDGRLEENSEPGFRTDWDVPIVVKDPDPATAEQMDYVRSTMRDFEDRLLGPNPSDPELGVRAVLDTSSFVDWYLVQELVRNQDVSFSSTFLSKPRGGKLTFGPLWDFDVAIGSTTGTDPQPPVGWKVRTSGPWYPALLADPALAAEVSERWAELRGPFLSIVQDLPATAASIQAAAENDVDRWGPAATPETETAEYLQSWLEQRIAWMDAELLPAG